MLKYKLTLNTGVEFESADHSTLIDFIKEHHEMLISSSEATLYSRYYPSKEEIAFIKSYPQIKKFETKIPTADGETFLDDLYGFCKIEYIDINPDEDLEFINDYIIFEKDPMTNQTKSGIVYDKKPLSFNTSGIVISSTSPLIEKGDKVFCNLDKTQWVTINNERYLVTHEKYILGKVSHADL